MKGINYSEEQGVDRGTVLKYILRKCGGRMRIGLLWLRTGSSDGSYEHGNEHLGSIKSEGMF
jgi:hypothetical protein